MKHGTMQLVKFKKLHRRLGFSTARETAGLLEVMWIVAARETPRGDIGSMDNETIAIELEWEGDPDALVNALVETRWLDEHPEHRLIVHDWFDHAPRFVHGIAAKKGGIIEATVPDYSPGLQSATTVGDEPADSPSPVRAGTTIPSLTNTIPSQEYSSDPSGSGVGSDDDEGEKAKPEPDPPGFNDFWQAYPKRDGKRRGRAKSVKLWRQLVRVAERDAVIAGARHYADSPDAKKNYAKDPERWLRDKCWLDWQEPPDPFEVADNRPRQTRIEIPLPQERNR